MKRLKLLPLVFLLFAFISCASKNKSYVLDNLPSWYNSPLKQDFVDVERLMSEGYSRLEALEVQSIALKDSRDKNIPFDKAFRSSIDSFKKGDIGPSGFAPVKEFKKGDFIVVFDLDETLFVQWYSSFKKGEKYRDLCSGTPDVNWEGDLESTDCVKFTPGIEKMFGKIGGLPGFRGIVLFTAKGDEAATAIVDLWKINGKPIRQVVKGVFTRDYLTRGKSAFKASKDLRIVDESLENVVMVDDNPSRLFQPKNVRVFPKFNGDNYLNSKYTVKDKTTIAYYEKLLETVYEELKDSAQYSQKTGVDFVEAFHPYSQHGMYCTRMIQDNLGLSKKKAADFHRKNPALCKDVFYGMPVKK